MQLRTHPRGIVGWIATPAITEASAQRPDCPAATFGITANLHDSPDAHLSGQAHSIFGIETRIGLRRVEMAMRVHYRRR